MRPEVPPKRITSTSTRPTRRAPPAAAREIHARRPGFTGWSSGATCPGQGAPSSCARCYERPAHPRGNILSFPGRGALPRHERDLLLAAHPTSIPHRSKSTCACRTCNAHARRRQCRLLARIATREGTVEVVGTRAGERAHYGRRGTRPRAGLHESPQSVHGEGEVGALRARRARRGDDQHDLTLHVFTKAPGELAQRGAGHLLVELRQLPADGRGAVGGKRSERGE